MNRSDVEAAADRFATDGRGFVRRTPLWKLPGRVLGVECAEVWLKLEQLQVAGSFKARGMYNRLLANRIPAGGVIVASGGNAGIATAAAARALDVPCEVFVPTVSSPAKQARLRQLGAKVVVTGAVYAEALDACLARQRETGALMTHAYDQPEVVAGAGTLAREIEEQGGEPPDSVLVSVGGGGLVAGIAAWFEDRSRVVALEPELAPTLARARAAGRPVDVEVGGIAADSLGARRIGELAFAVAQRFVERVILVSDDDIVAAQRLLWDRLRILAEPGGATALAGLLGGSCAGRVGVVVCGGNTDPARFA